MNCRRKLILLGAGAIALPLLAFAQQQAKVWRIGFLSTRSRPPSLDADFYSGFPRGMRELGYVDGKNIVVEWRFAGSDVESLSAMAAELVRLKADVIVTAGTAATSAAQKATASIPIVMGAAADPVGSGLVASLARPGGNITGLSNLSGDLRPKQLEMLLAAMPRLARVAVLIGSSDQATVANLRAAAQKTNVTILPMEARSPREIDDAFSRMIREKAGAVIVSLNPLFVQQRQQIAVLSIKNWLPSVSPNREYAEAGGLMSYGQDQSDSYRRAAIYVDKILKGAKPGDLPIEQPITLELVVNMKAAKTLGITIPQSILVRADKVIE